MSIWNLRLRRTRRRFGSGEWRYSSTITRREILFSVAIVCVLLAVGVAISGRIDAALQDEYQAYNTALRIADDAELFGYAMRTNAGNAFIHGDLRAVGPVSIPDLSGEYGYIKKVEQHYTMHTRRVTKTDGNGKTRTRTETYWTWDDYQHWEWHCEAISFLGYTFPYGTIELPGAKYHSTIRETIRVRFEYYVCPTLYTGTLWARLAAGISNTRFFDGLSIDETIARLESGWQKIVFWVAWVLLTGLAVFGFCYLDNRWLNE